MGFQTEIRMGDEIRIKGARLYPLTKVVSTFWREGGAIWNRPDSVLVKMDDGEEHILEVRDVTREMQIKLLALGVIASLITWLLFRGR